jgi:hypothetical protein
VAALAYVLTYAVNVPFWDEWEFVRLLEVADRGQLTVGDILQQHNEHRIAAPRIFAIGVAWLTAYDTVAQCLFTVFHLTVMLVYAYAAVRRTTGAAIGTAPLWFVAVAWLLLSWRQAENLIWGFQIGLSLPLTFAFIGLFHLQVALETKRRRVLSILLASIGATLASFSSAMGLLVWPAGLVVALLHWRMDRAARHTTMLWIGTGVVVWFAYFVGYQSPPHHASVTVALSQPARLLSFFLTLCGLWAAGSSFGALGGSLVLIAVVTCCIGLWRRGELARHGLWIGVSLWCVLTLAMIAAGRSSNPAVAYRSAYATYSLPIAAALVALLAAWLRGRRSVPVAVVTWGGMLLFVAGTVNGYSVGRDIAEGDWRARSRLASMLVDYRNRSDSELAVLYPDCAKVRDGADFLARKRWSVFAENDATPRRRAADRYLWGDLLRFGVDGNARPYLGKGWSIDEDGFTWTVGKSAFLEVLVDAQPAPLRLELTYAMTLLVEGRVEAQRVLVYHDGNQVGQFVATTNGHVAVDLSVPSVPSGSFCLELRLPDAVAPATLGVGGERRELGVAVASVRLVARS